MYPAVIVIMCVQAILFSGRDFRQLSNMSAKNSFKLNEKRGQEVKVPDWIIEGFFKIFLFFSSNFQLMFIETS